MKIRLVKVDNRLIDVSTKSELDEIPGNGEVELRAIMPLSMKVPDLLMRKQAPYFRRVETQLNLGKMIAESIVPLYELPADIQALWCKFDKAVVSWAEKEVNGD